MKSPAAAAMGLRPWYRYDVLAIASLRLVLFWRETWPLGPRQELVEAGVWYEG